MYICNGWRGQLSSKWRHNENGGCERCYNKNDVTMRIAGLWRYGDWQHVDTALVVVMMMMVVEH